MRDLIGPIPESTQKSKPAGLNAAEAGAAGPAMDTPIGTSIAAATPIAARFTHEPDRVVLPGLRALRIRLDLSPERPVSNRMATTPASSSDTG
ncbi:hypothetical protein FMUAM8_01440 [Nocardia cyriacigeorgica]|nr:hypothetical protein FMUAM8_01440 [Nocardia cyriacigeorgica]